MICIFGLRVTRMFGIVLLIACASQLACNDCPSCPTCPVFPPIVTTWETSLGGFEVNSSNSVVATPDLFVVAGNVEGSFLSSRPFAGNLLKSSHARPQVSGGYLSALSPDKSIAWQLSLDTRFPLFVGLSAIALSGGAIAVSGVVTDSLYNPSGWWEYNDYLYLANVSPTGSIGWEKKYPIYTVSGIDTFNVDWYPMLSSTLDGGFVLATSAWSWQASRMVVRIIKTDASGNMQWDKLVGTFVDGCAVNAVVPVTNGIVVVGQAGDYPYDAFALKSDASGNLQWQNSYGGPADDVFFSAQPLDGGGLLALGTTMSYGSGSGDMYAVWLDDQGTLIQQKTYGSSLPEFGYDIAVNSSGQFVLAGGVYIDSADQQFEEHSDVYLTKIDRDGNLLWEGNLGDQIDSESGYSIFALSGGGYVLVGSLDSRNGADGVYVARLNEQGGI